MRNLVHRWSASLLAVAALALGLVGCSSDSSQPGPDTSPPATSESAPTGHGGYAKCLADNGVPIAPAGPGAPPGVDEGT